PPHPAHRPPRPTPAPPPHPPRRPPALAGRGEPARLERAHQLDAAARAVGFVAGREKRGARLEAKTAMHAGVERGEPPAIRHSAPSAATTNASPGSNVRRSPATSGPTPSRYAPKWPTAERTGQGARSSVSGTSRPASVRRSRLSRSIEASPPQRIAPIAGLAEIHSSPTWCCSRSSSSSLESGRPPIRNATGRVAKLSAARIHRL